MITTVYPEHRQLYPVVLALADGSRFAFEGLDVQASRVVSKILSVMQLQPFRNNIVHGYVIVTNTALSVEVLHLENRNFTVRIPIIYDDNDRLAVQCMHLATILALQSQPRGGALLHGALAERDGCGVVMAGRSGAGKTTTSSRIGPPWYSWSDDLVLVVRDNNGQYWAHPWPTWSKFMFGGPGGSWNVQHAVPLKGIFFLKQALEDRAEPVGGGQAASWLVESAEQVSWPMTRDMGEGELRAFRLQRFDNICALAKAVPTYLLHISLTGAFWEEIEHVLDSEQVA